MPALLPMKLRMSRTLELEVEAAQTLAQPEQRRRPLARLLAQRVDARARPRRSIRSRIVRSRAAARDAASRLVRVHLDRLAVLEQGGVELILFFELAGPADVLLRGALHRALERDLVSGLSGFACTARCSA